MMKRYLVLGCLVLAASVAGQVQHAPTVAQCQADQRLWMSKLEAEPSNPGTAPIFEVMVAWSHEMSDCQEVDPANRVKYYNANGEIWVDLLLRQEKFLRRHQMWEKFIEEDAAGRH
jgi:hypothetical protein